MNSQIARLWEREYQRQRLHHAYLVNASATLARELAIYCMQGLNCQRPAGVQPCLECESCRLSYMARIELEPEDGHISSDRLREGVEFLETTTGDDRFAWKGLLVFDAERMTANDAVNRVQENLLLKTLEEPPVHSVIFLCTRSPSFFLPTVRSRMALLDLRALEHRQYADQLNDLQLPADGIELLKVIGNSELDSSDDIEFIARCVAFGRGLLSRRVDMGDLKYVLDREAEWELLLQVLQRYYRDVLRYHLTGRQEKIYRIPLCKKYEIFQIVDWITRMRQILSTTRSSPRYHLMSLLARRSCRIV